MKNILYIAAITTAMIFSSCENTDANKTAEDSTDLDVLTNTPGGSNVSVMPKEMHSDLNATDADGKKQGKWIIYGKMSGDAAFNLTAKYEEGNYKNDLKDGEWIQYNPNGTVKRTIKFTEGKEDAK